MTGTENVANAANLIKIIVVEVRLLNVTESFKHTDPTCVCGGGVGRLESSWGHLRLL